MLEYHVKHVKHEQLCFGGIIRDQEIKKNTHTTGNKRRRKTKTQKGLTNYFYTCICLICIKTQYINLTKSCNLLTRIKKNHMINTYWQRGGC